MIAPTLRSALITVGLILAGCTSTRILEGGATLDDEHAIACSVAVDGAAWCGR